MAIIRKRTPKQEVPYEKRTDITIKKLFLHVTIVPGGHGQTINKLFKNLGVACQFTHRGKGTANTLIFKGSVDLSFHSSIYYLFNKMAVYHVEYPIRNLGEKNY